jgi:hypothetical protein
MNTGRVSNLIIVTCTSFVGAGHILGGSSKMELVTRPPLPQTTPHFGTRAGHEFHSKTSWYDVTRPYYIVRRDNRISPDLKNGATNTESVGTGQPYSIAPSLQGGANPHANRFFYVYAPRTTQPQ